MRTWRILHGEVEQDGKTLQEILRPPEGHPIQVVRDTPQFMPNPPAGVDGGSVAAMGLMAGIIITEGGRRVHDILKHRKEEG
jgi:hypothetical protein